MSSGADGRCPRHRSEWGLVVEPGRFDITVRHGLPLSYEDQRAHAELSDEYALDAPEGTLLFVSASDAGGTPARPRLTRRATVRTVWERFPPQVTAGCDGDLLLVGAGERLLAYRIGSGPVTRLWEGRAAGGFWGWDARPDVVIMSAELEVAAWTADGTSKLWATPVEPPWHYRVADGHVLLDVMGERTRFGVRVGPS